MTSFVQLLCVAAMATMALGSAAFHQRHVGSLERRLAEHRVVPPGLCPLTSRLLIAAELAIGVLAVAAGFRPSSTVVVLGLTLSCLVASGVFVTYLRLARSVAPSSSCGCSGFDVRLDQPAVFVPALMLAAFAACLMLLWTSAAGAGLGALASGIGVAALLPVMSGVCAGALAIVAPAALAFPDSSGATFVPKGVR